MKKLKALSKAAVIPALVVGTSFAPFISEGIARAATTYHWAGLNAPSAYINTGSPSNNISDPNNWSSTTNVYTAATTGFSAGADLVFDIGGPTSETTTGTLPSAPAEVDVKSGLITIGSSAGSPLPIAPGGELLVDTPSDSANNSLTVNNVTDTGALIIDGMTTLPAAGTGGIAGPVTLQTSDPGVTSPVFYARADIENLLGVGVGGHVNLGNNAEVDLIGNDFTTNSLWTIEVDTGGLLTLQGSAPNSGNNQQGTVYSEASLIGNGGIFQVVNAVGNPDVVTVNNLTLDANSIAEVTEADDALKAATFTSNGFSFSKPSTGTWLGSFPVDSGAGAGGTPAPNTPDTGFGLVSAKLLPVVATTLAAAGGLLLAARRLRLRPATKR